MLDTFAPLQPTAAALAVEDPGYERSFVAEGNGAGTPVAVGIMW